MDKLVVVRIGNASGLLQSWYNQKKWSTAENQNIIRNQIIRDLYVEGYNVYILFLESGDIPVYTARVTNVRPRNITDIAYPIANEHGPFQTFIEFDKAFKISADTAVVYRPLLDSIRYKRGQQLHLNGLLSELPIAICKTLETIDDLYVFGNGHNRTVINPKYNLYQ
jgi:hypothetical protein